jgi:hypothetical protein
MERSSEVLRGVRNANEGVAVVLHLDVHHESRRAVESKPMAASRASSLREASVSTTNGSWNTVAASSKRTPCFCQLAAAFASFHRLHHLLEYCLCKYVRQARDALTSKGVVSHVASMVRDDHRRPGR